MLTAVTFTSNRLSTARFDLWSRCIRCDFKRSPDHVAIPSWISPVANRLDQCGVVLLDDCRFCCLCFCHSKSPCPFPTLMQTDAWSGFSTASLVQRPICRDEECHKRLHLHRAKHQYAGCCALPKQRLRSAIFTVDK